MERWWHKCSFQEAEEQQRTLMSSLHVFIMENNGELLIARVLLWETNVTIRSVICKVKVSEQSEKLKWSKSLRANGSVKGFKREEK